ncbi:MAG: DUF5103 domain-containing protein [Prolixibacteraceae bacterium]
MKIAKHLACLVLSVVICTGYLLGQPIKPNVGKSDTAQDIHTVLFFTEGWEFSLPVLELGSSRRLICKFDLFARDPKNYRYTIVHCDADWNPSRLVTSEYLEGFADNTINDYDFSINTTVPYINYRLVLPNENVLIRLSGNYLLKVWEDGKKDQPVLIKPFYVTEKEVEITGEVQKATYEGYSGASQQMTFAVNYPGFPISDPLNEIKTVVMQNSRSDNRLIQLKPTFIRQNQLVFEDKINPFRGGNEFRNFNAKNLQTNGMGIRAIEFRDPYYFLFLETDQSRRNEQYLTRNDLNGSFLVKNDRVSDSDLESDYIYVHFSLAPPDLVSNDQIFIFGALTDWQCLPGNQMIYQPDTKLYEADLLLKQGFYDYQYVIINKDTKAIDATFMEGSHVETENNYHIFVYYRGFSSRYDRLIGYRMINSINR